MSLEAVKQVTVAEEQCRVQKAQAQQDARRLFSDADKAGQALVAKAEADARAQADALLAQAEQTAAGEIAQIQKDAAADAQKLRSKAEGRLEEATSLIVRKVVDA